MDDPIYNIEFTETAVKSLKRIPNPFRENIVEKIIGLGESSFDNNNVTRLVGYSKTYRLRVGDYRVLFDKDTKLLIIEIIDIRHRKESYRS